MGKIRKIVSILVLISGVFFNFSLDSYGDISKAKDFTLQDQNGSEVSLSDYDNKIVVLEWLNPDCPFVQRHYKEKTMVTLSDRYKESEVVWLAINSTHYMGEEDNKKWADTFNVSYPILDDHSGEVGKVYGAKTTPHMFIIDTTDNLVYNGAIDDDPRGSKAPGERTNYVDNALFQMEKGEVVEISKSKPYGCSVKYSK